MGSKLPPTYRGPRVVRKLKNNWYVVVDLEGFKISQRPYQESR